MKGESLGRRYAKALIESIEDDNLLDRVHSELEVLSVALVSDKRGRVFFIGKTVSPEKKLEFLQKILDNFDIAPITKKFLKIVAGHNRMEYLPVISLSFGKFLDEKRNIERVTVTLSAPITTGQKKKLVASLEEARGKNIILEPVVNKDLLGGMVIRIAGKIYDSSILKQLQLLKNRLQTADA